MTRSEKQQIKTIAERFIFLRAQGNGRDTIKYPVIAVVCV